MAKKLPLETKLPDEQERHRARFMGITVERIKFLQWYLPYSRWRCRPETPPHLTNSNGFRNDIAGICDECVKEQKPSERYYCPHNKRLAVLSEACRA